MKGTNLPNSIIKTFVDLMIEAMRSPSSYGNQILERMQTIRPGFWMLEKSSFKERREETGSFDSIVRFICYYQKTPDSEIQYCTENSAGEYMTWGNASFYSLLAFDEGWNKYPRICDRNLTWAKQAIKRHELDVDLEGEEKLFFDKEKKDEEFIGANS